MSLAAVIKAPLVSHKGCEWGGRHAGGIANAPGGTQAQIMGHGVMRLLRRVVVYYSYADGCREGECCCCDGTLMVRTRVRRFEGNRNKLV